MSRIVAVVVSCGFVLALAFVTLAQPGPPPNPGKPVEGLQVVDSLGGVVGPLVTQNEVAIFLHNRWQGIGIAPDGFMSVPESAGGKIKKGLAFFFTESEVDPEMDGCMGTRYLLEDALPPGAPLLDGVLYTVGHPVQILTMNSRGTFNTVGLITCTSENFNATFAPVVPTTTASLDVVFPVSVE